MPTYRYTARDERGKVVEGTMVASATEGLADQLKHMGYLVTKSREVTDGVSLQSLVQRVRRVGYDDLVLFNIQLSKMIQVGLPLLTALDTLARQTVHPTLRNAVADVSKQIEAGASFSEALARHPGVFSTLFISMVRAGEVSGKLDEILSRLATFAKHQAELRNQLQTALTYPVLLVIVSLGVMGFLMLGIIPKFMKIFFEAGVPLPAPTQFLYSISLLLRRYGIALIGLLMVGGWLLQRVVRTPAGRRRWDALLLKAPLFGDLVRKASLSRLARTLETLFSSGVPVLESLSIAEQTCGNVIIAEACQAAQTSVREGGTMADPLEASHQVPPMVVQMIRVGEASGTVDHMLAEIADHYDELIRHQLKRITALIEPFFLMIIGGMVALIMASILLPLFRMVNVIRS